LSVERLDSAERAETEKNLRDIARINRWFGGHRTLVRLLGMFVGTKDRFSLLDVGAASGDMGRYVQKRFPNAQVVSLDRRPLHLKTVTTPRIAADARSLPFARCQLRSGHVLISDSPLCKKSSHSYEGCAGSQGAP
jgi:hypothetical protein